MHPERNQVLSRGMTGMGESPVDLLEIGLSGELHIREERVSTHQDASRLLYVSDIHLRRGRSENICRQVIASVRRCDSDAVLLGGDLVDSASELEPLTELVGALCAFGPVLAVGGNHDDRVGMKRVRDAVLGGGGDWIHDRSYGITHGSRTITVSGPEADSLPYGDVHVLCAHNPRIWKESRTRGYDLVLAGHLHGCQLVAFKYRDRLYPGAFFYPDCYLSHQDGPTKLVVSRGVSDLVPIRWRCPREVVLCHV